jgi:hypothetical protein
MSERDERKQTDRGRIEINKTTSKPGSLTYPGSSAAETYLLAVWCPVYRRHDSHSGLDAELGNSACDAKRKPYKCDSRRGKVSMHMQGADFPVGSDEALVMSVERRGKINSKKAFANRVIERSASFRSRPVVARVQENG